MRIGFGISKLREPEAALQEAFRSSLKAMQSTTADFCLVFYSYDHGLDLASLGSVFRKVFRQIPHLGSSTWGAFGDREGFEAETGMVVASFKDLPATPYFLKVHSLREKAEVWAAEIARQMGDRLRESTKNSDFVFLIADSLNFVPGMGLSFLEKHFPQTQMTGFGTSFSVPQSSVVCCGEVYTNAMVGVGLEGVQTWLGLAQNIRPELQSISINRMSENLIIEVDEKPAFYKLCEHLMTIDDLPMMSPDDFRKHMGNLYLVERPKPSGATRIRAFGEAYRAIPLLGSEMTTGMVAVGQGLDFSCDHFLGQKKPQYLENDLRISLEKMRAENANSSFLLLLCASNHWRDRDRTTSDMEIVREIFPNTPLLGVATNGEYVGLVNQFATVVVAFP